MSYRWIRHSVSTDQIPGIPDKSYPLAVLGYDQVVHGFLGKSERLGQRRTTHRHPGRLRSSCQYRHPAASVNEERLPRAFPPVPRANAPLWRPAPPATHLLRHLVHLNDCQIDQLDATTLLL